jgi:competence ComEA-like helix-hairpin-helix protein
LLWSKTVRVEQFTFALPRERSMTLAPADAARLSSMPTPSEQKALAFVAIAILLGGAVRVLRAGAAATPSPLEQQALGRQASAAESASAAAKAAKQVKRSRSGKVASSRRDTVSKIVAGVASVPPTFARPDRPFAHSNYGTPSARLGFPPPDPRYDTQAGGALVAAASTRRADGRKPDASPSAAGSKLDLDVASAHEVEALPRIGPALANRIVASRDSLGPFRSIEGLRRVKGLGAATLERLAPFITFSGRPAAPAPKP